MWIRKREYQLLTSDLDLVRERLDVQRDMLASLRDNLRDQTEMRTPMPGDNALWHMLERKKYPIGKVVDAIIKHLGVSLEKQKEVIYLSKK